MERKEIAMNNLKEVNSNFLSLLNLDLDDVRKKLEQNAALFSQQETKTVNGADDSNTTKRKIKHSEIFKLLLNNIDKVDFREEAGADVDKDKLKYNDYLVTCSEKVLEVAEEC